MKKIDIGSLADLLTRLICCTGRKKASKIPLLKFDLILTGLCANFLKLRFNQYMKKILQSRTG